MNDRKKPVARGAVAGSVLLATALLVTALAAGLGALIGAPAAFAIGGFFVGIGAGIYVVARRFSDL